MYGDGGGGRGSAMHGKQTTPSGVRAGLSTASEK